MYIPDVPNLRNRGFFVFLELHVNQSENICLLCKARPHLPGRPEEYLPIQLILDSATILPVL